MSQLNITMDKFYTSMLEYAGIRVENNVFVNTNPKLGDISIDGKALTLPYFDNLKNPDNKVIFHLLNENYTSPENAIFNLYKKRLVLEMNLKISSLFISLISIASDPQLQSKIKSGKLIELISGLGEIDHTLIENFLSLVKASKKENDEAFILDVFLKKNGELKDVPYAAIGKINFHLYTEVVKALEDKEREYRVFGHKVRKKDLLALESLFNTVFPSIDNKDAYSEGTDNKVFRYLNILLKTSYIVAHRVNEIVKLLEEMKEPSLNLDDIRFDLDWTHYLEKLYDMGNEIRLIPNQLDLTVEATKLKLDESKAQSAPAPTPSQQPMQFDPTRAQAPTQPTPQPQVYQQPVQQQPLSPEDIIRASMGGMPMQPGMMMQQPMMQPMQQPGMMMMPQPMMQQPPMPLWMQQEMMRSGQMPMQQQPMQQPGMMPHPMPYGMMQPGMMMQQPMMQQPMQQPSGLQVNPHFFNRQQAPWS